MVPQLFFIKESYFIDHQDYIKMLDAGNTNKQTKRTHLCVQVNANNNIFYIPLRNNLGAEVRKYGRIGHSVPSLKRAAAGLDYRYALIINDSKYLEPQTTIKIPTAQMNKITAEYTKIQQEFEVYLNGFIKAAKKGRVEKEPLYRESSLINYYKELQIKNHIKQK